MILEKSVHVDTLSSSGITPLFFVHEWRWEASVATPQAGMWAVLAMQLAPAIGGESHHYELLLIDEDGFLHDGCARDYVRCPGASCSVPKCSRATPPTPAGAHEAEYPLTRRPVVSPRACALCGATDVDLRADDDDLICADWPACQARRVVRR